MKKLFLLFIATLTLMTSQAQWVDDAVNNTFLANTSDDAGEIYIATDDVTGDTYFHWMQFGPNGWSPNVQRITSDGVPQWGANGIHIGGPQFASYSDGVAMAALAGGGVVCCFANNEGYIYAVKINADGTFAWGEEGIQLFGDHWSLRTELTATSDGGVWALGFDYNNTYVCYIEGNGTQHPTITISESGCNCLFSQMLPNTDEAVFIIYEKLFSQGGIYSQKELWVVSYTREGNLVAPASQLMAGASMPNPYCHYVVPDGLGGGYVYIWHPSTGSFNTYVFHFDANGASTIDNINGVSVHSDDLDNLYLDAYATVDPITHDLVIAYQQTDAAYQRESRVYVNRITPSGQRLWDEGKLVYDNNMAPIGRLVIDAFEDGSGFSVIFVKGIASNDVTSTLEAIGLDSKGDQIWATQMSSTLTNRTAAQNSSGFLNGQNIMAWVNATEDVGGLYAQNIQPDGSMGIVVPPQPPVGCLGPENFRGEYVYDDETMTFGALLSWDQPEEPVEVYRLTRKSKSTGEEAVIEFTTERPTYFDFSGIGRFRYQLQALYANLDCGFSQPATTPDGADFVSIEVTSVPENNEEAIVTVLNVYTMNGQRVQSNRLETLSKGIYLLEGLTSDGKRIHRKIAITE